MSASGPAPIVTGRQRSRGGRRGEGSDGLVVALASDGDQEIVTRADHVLRVLPKLELLSPILFAIPPQLLAYRTAGLRHCDVDRPRE